MAQAPQYTEGRPKVHVVCMFTIVCVWYRVHADGWDAAAAFPQHHIIASVPIIAPAGLTEVRLCCASALRIFADGAIAIARTSRSA